MTPVTKLTIALTLISLFSCQYHYHADDDDAIAISEVGYADYEVDFFTSHPDWIYLETEFETVSEQILVREAHQEGAHFELLSETVLTQQAHQIYQIEEAEQISMVQNAETLKAQSVVCHDFWESDEIVTVEVPAEYKTIFRQAVVQQGTGAEVPAEYSIRTRRMVKTPAQLLPQSQERAFERVTFRIPDTLTIAQYLFNQIPASLFDFCEEGRSYRIN